MFPSDASVCRSAPSLRWLPQGLRFATLIGTMSKLRRPCNLQRRFVALSAPDHIQTVSLCPRFWASPCGGLPSATESLVVPAQLIPGFLDVELHGPHRFLYDLIAFRPGLRPRRRVPVCPSSPVTFCPHPTHGTGHSDLVFRGSIPRLSARGLRFHASIALHGQGSLPAARTCFAGRVQACALPQGHCKWFLFRLHFISSIHRLFLSREQLRLLNQNV